MLEIKNKPLVTVLKIQLLFILIAVIIFAYWFGLHGAISATLGGGINVLAGVVFGLIISRHQGFLPGDVIKTALKAEVFKIICIVFCCGWFLRFIPMLFQRSLSEFLC